MAIRRLAKCACGEVFEIPESDIVEQHRDEFCPNPDECSFLSRCDHCKWTNFLAQYSTCSCEYQRVVKQFEQEINENGSGADFGLVGVSRIPKEEQWNPALGEVCRTTGDVEKYRKQQGKVYAGREDEPPKPYKPKESCQASKKRLKSLGLSND